MYTVQRLDLYNLTKLVLQHCQNFGYLHQIMTNQDRILTSFHSLTYKKIPAVPSILAVPAVRIIPAVLAVLTGPTVPAILAIPTVPTVQAYVPKFLCSN